MMMMWLVFLMFWKKLIMESQYIGVDDEVKPPPSKKTMKVMISSRDFY